MIATKKASTLEKILVPFAHKLAQQRHLAAIQKAFMSCMPIMIIGSFALILADPPVDYTTLDPGSALYGFFSGWAAFATVAGDVLYGMFNVSLACISIYVCLGISFFLSQHYKIIPLLPMITAFGAFLVLNSKWVDGAWQARFFEGPGLFAAILVGLVSTECYRFLIQHKVGNIKLPDSVPEALSSSFGSLAPITIIILAASLISALLSGLFQASLPELVGKIIAPLVAVVDNVFGASFATLLQQILWWFGIHDTAIGTILEPIRVANYTANVTAYAAGTPIADLPHILTNGFWFVFCTIGGAGATFGLAVIMLKARSKQLKTVGKLAIIPAFFNINEPILFGMPIVLNPLFLIPFIGAQLANCIITYLSMSMGLVNKTFLDAGWNLFAPVAAFISTMDPRAVILALGLIVLDCLIYLPFFKIYDSTLLKQETAEEQQG